MVQKNAFWQDSPRTLSDAVNLYKEYAHAAVMYTDYDAVVDYETLWKHPAQELAHLLSKLELDPEPAADLVAKVHEGKSLPGSLAGVYREGTPGQGEKHFCTEVQTLVDASVPNSTPSYSVLLATNHLLGWTGSETLLLTLAQGLLENNCRVTIYTRHWDEDWLDRHFDPRIRVTDDLNAVRHCSFDLAHVQHNSCVVDVRAARPTLPIIFSSLGVLPFLEQPLPFDIGISRFLAISEEVAANFQANGIPNDKIHIIRNLVDARCFMPSGPIRPKVERILVLSYRMDADRRKLLRLAAKRIGASIRFVGDGHDVLTPENLAIAINQADLVVSLGRGVVETMLCGRVPLVFDVHGGDGLVTPDNLHTIRTCNFSGRLHRTQYTLEDLVTEIEKYRPQYGDRLRELAVQDFSSERNLPRLLTIYAAVADTYTPVSLPYPMPEVLKFCSAIAREDVLQSKRRQNGELHLLGEIHRMKRTLSWRITMPFRVIWNFIRRRLDDD